MRLLLRCLIGAGCLAAVTPQTTARADVFYVNNRLGSDRNDGRVDRTVGTVSGPVATISRALRLANYADTIIVANTGYPYRESLSLNGRKHSGTPTEPFRIVGNGAEVLGSRPIPETGWQPVGNDLWKLDPYRKGHYVLTLDGAMVEEVRPEAGVQWKAVPDLAVNTWCAWRGSIYYRSERTADPAEHNFGVAIESCGITLFHAHNVLIQDLSLKHFRLDGINAHDLADGIVIQNVTLAENGRAGLAVGGSSVVTLTDAVISSNRDFSILVQEQGGLAVEDSTIDVDPVVRD